MLNIYQTINAIMTDLEPIAKAKKNQQQGFMYRGVDDVMNSMAPLFAKHKLFVVPEVIEHTREERKNAKGTTLLYSIAKMKYTFYAEDGSYIESVVIGEGMDSGDKATNKAMAIAFKYACFQVFCIPTEETAPDADRDTHQVEPKDKKSQTPQQKSTQVNGQVTDAMVKNMYAIGAVKKMSQAMVEKGSQKYYGKQVKDLTIEEFNQLEERIALMEVAE